MIMIILVVCAFWTTQKKKWKRDWDQWRLEEDLKAVRRKHHWVWFHWLSFVAYQTPKVIQCQILFTHTHKHIYIYEQIFGRVEFYSDDKKGWLVGWLGFYAISTFVVYLLPNPFLYK